MDSQNLRSKWEKEKDARKRTFNSQKELMAGLAEEGGAAPTDPENPISGQLCPYETNLTWPVGRIDSSAMDSNPYRAVSSQSSRSPAEFVKCCGDVV